MRGVAAALAFGTATILAGCTTPSSQTYLDWPVRTRLQHPEAPARTVVVRTGDTVSEIAARYDVPEETVLTMNHLSKRSLIYPGDKLALPINAKEPQREVSRERKIEAHNLTPVRVAHRNAGFKSVRVARIEPLAAPVPERRPQREARGEVRFVWPVQGSIISHFGEGPGGERNDGINIATYMGAPVRAAAAGVVTYAGNELRRYGNLVIIKHDDGYITVYAHEKSISVTKGERVARGETIGVAGETGAVDRPQLHFEVRYDTQPVNPRPLLGASPARAAS